MVNLPSILSDNKMCFNKDEFMKVHFSVEDFIVDCRRRVPLETLRTDLNTHLKVIQNALIELINKDYADFVNLSSNLVGLDSAIKNLTSPIDQLCTVVKDTQEFMNVSLSEIDAKIARKTEIQNQKALLFRLSGILQTVNRMEKLLGINSESPTNKAVVLTGQLIERSATQLNKLSFNVGKCQGHPILDQLQPRINTIIRILENGLRQKFMEALTCKSDIMTSSTDSILNHAPSTHTTTTSSTLRQCLRTYAAINKTHAAEDLFQIHIVRPAISQAIVDFYSTNCDDLSSLFSQLLVFVNTDCQRLTNITHPTAAANVDASCYVEGFEFLVNSVWPEIANAIDAKLSFIFAPGNPETFHQKYLQTLEFVNSFESSCMSESSVRRLRKKPTYVDFISKWSMPVYFQIRFQEIAGTYENALSNPFVMASDSEFSLLCFHQLYHGLEMCWNHDVYLEVLAHRFWKLSLQLLSRAQTATGEFIDKQSTLCKDNAMDNYIHYMKDMQLIHNKAKQLFTNKIVVKLSQLNINDMSIFKESFDEACAAILVPMATVNDEIVSCVYDRCSAHCKSLNDIPRLYRHTNKEVPCKASHYVSCMVKPLQDFQKQHRQSMTSESMHKLSLQVITKLLQVFSKSTSDLLLSVSKMEESIKRLKKSKNNSTQSQTGQMSDNDKIRKQIFEDVKQLGEMIRGCDIDTSSITHYNDLYEIVCKAMKTPI